MRTRVRIICTEVETKMAVTDTHHKNAPEQRTVKQPGNHAIHIVQRGGDEQFPLLGAYGHRLRGDHGGHEVGRADPETSRHFLGSAGVVLKVFLGHAVKVGVGDSGDAGPDQFRPRRCHGGSGSIDQPRAVGGVVIQRLEEFLFDAADRDDGNQIPRQHPPPGVVSTGQRQCR